VLGNFRYQFPCLLEIMAIVVQEKNTFLGLVSAEEVLCSQCIIPGVGTLTPVPVRRAQSVPPSFRPATVISESKQWSDIMSESTEAPDWSSDCDDLSSNAASSHGLSDSSPSSRSNAASLCGLNECLPSSRSDSDNAPPRRPTALRLSARRYDPCAGEVSCVLGILMTFLRSIPTVTDVAQDCSTGGKSVRYLVTMPKESMKNADRVITGAQQTLLSAACNSQNVYVMGHARDPFTSLGVHCWGFQGQLCMRDEQLCMDALDFGRCNRWCPHTVCRRKHPQAAHLTEVIVEIQAS